MTSGDKRRLHPRSPLTTFHAWEMGQSVARPELSQRPELGLSEPRSQFVSRVRGQSKVRVTHQSEAGLRYQLEVKVNGAFETGVGCRSEGPRGPMHWVWMERPHWVAGATPGDLLSVGQLLGSGVTWSGEGPRERQSYRLLFLAEVIPWAQPPQAWEGKQRFRGSSLRVPVSHDP